jgi:hypothetical protein
MTPQYWFDISQRLQNASRLYELKHVTGVRMSQQIGPQVHSLNRNVRLKSTDYLLSAIRLFDAAQAQPDLLRLAYGDAAEAFDALAKEHESWGPTARAAIHSATLTNNRARLYGERTWLLKYVMDVPLRQKVHNAILLLVETFSSLSAVESRYPSFDHLLGERFRTRELGCATIVPSAWALSESPSMIRVGTELEEIVIRFRRHDAASDEADKPAEHAEVKDHSWRTLHVVNKSSEQGVYEIQSRSRNPTPPSTVDSVFDRVVSGFEVMEEAPLFEHREVLSKVMAVHTDSAGSLRLRAAVMKQQRPVLRRIADAPDPLSQLEVELSRKRVTTEKSRELLTPVHWRLFDANGIIVSGGRRVFPDFAIYSDPDWTRLLLVGKVFPRSDITPAKIKTLDYLCQQFALVCVRIYVPDSHSVERRVGVGPEHHLYQYRVIRHGQVIVARMQ